MSKRREAARLRDQYGFTLLLCGTLLTAALLIVEDLHSLFPVRLMVYAIVLTGLSTIHAGRRIRSWGVAIAALSLLLVELNHRARWNINSLAVAQMLVTMLLFTLVGLAVLRAVLSHRLVTGETINGALCVYLIIGIVFGLTYSLIAYLQPGGFRANVPDAKAALSPPYSGLIYYSFVTITTLGFGDISPVNSAIRAVTILQAVVGQFYLAAMIARLVGLHIAHIHPPNRSA
jgi:hypothetical protein